MHGEMSHLLRPVCGVWILERAAQRLGRGLAKRPPLKCPSSQCTLKVRASYPSVWHGMRYLTVGLPVTLFDLINLDEKQASQDEKGT